MLKTTAAEAASDAQRWNPNPWARVPPRTPTSPPNQWAVCFSSSLPPPAAVCSQGRVGEASGRGARAREESGWSMQGVRVAGTGRNGGRG